MSGTDAEDGNKMEVSHSLNARDCTTVLHSAHVDAQIAKTRHWVGHRCSGKIAEGSGKMHADRLRRGRMPGWRTGCRYAFWCPRWAQNHQAAQLPSQMILRQLPAIRDSPVGVQMILLACSLKLLLFSKKEANTISSATGSTESQI